MSTKDAGMRIRVETELREAFVQACQRQGFAAAEVLLSPNQVAMAGEIRAYPLFLALSAWAVLAFLRQVWGGGQP